MTPLSPNPPTTKTTSGRIRVRSDEAVISQWLLDQTRSTMVRTRAERRPLVVRRKPRQPV